ncbi:hypothetical protein M3D75_12590 [Microbacterium enclense]|uniref:hypothetical protein n=1 Tax=Microbacterium enclense TaxID=993073 RepID=UPI0021A64858|nr:hypothetical protein [Microbacterium enclense]MCT2086958.1 hypothetical protein [Microbacterium enclense]
MTWGDDEAVWSSGGWTLVRRRGDELADIAHEGRSVLRSVRLAVRDRDWNTLPLQVEAVSENPGCLRLHVRVSGGPGAVEGELVARVEGDRLEIAVDLICTAALETNRTGLVVLHPPAVSGRALGVIHPDGAEDRTRFPVGIRPHQPATDIASLKWTSDAGEMLLHFSGDVFEMEDQRNWTDASFKTYNRPLALPFPVRLGAGERVAQTLTLERIGAVPAPAPARPTTIDLRAEGVVPSLGIAASTAPDLAEAMASRPIPAATVLVEVDLASPAWSAALARAQRAGLPLDVRFIVDEGRPDALRAGIDALTGIDVRRVTAFRAAGPARHVSDADTIAALRAGIDRAGLRLPVAGGVRTHFTELNREHHRLPSGLDGIGFAITPLFHDVSTAQLVESVAMQRLVAQQAVGLADGVPVDIGPIGLLPHVNAVATTPDPRPTHADLRDGYGPALLPAADARQDAAQLAAWTIASAAALTVPGVRSLTYFEEWGPRGIRNSDGTDRPVAAAIAALAELGAYPTLTGDSPDGTTWAVGALTPAGTVLLLANLDDRSRELAVRTPHGSARARLDAFGWTRMVVR